MAGRDLRAASSFDRANALIALAVGLIALIVYYLTKAPTLSFWDCGEFIAAAYTLGVPHPPGSPLYIMLGRLFTVLPLASDIAVRVNLLSAVSSAAAAVFGYLIVVRVLRSLFAGPSWFDRATIYGGGFAGALFAAFSLTNWNNSVETEVYGLAMMLTLAIVWLALVYHDNSGTPFGDRIMLLAIFVAFVGVGVHMTVFMALLVAALFFILRKDAGYSIWFAVAIYIGLELYLIFAMSSRPNEIPYYIPVLIVAIFYFLYMFSYDEIPRLHMLVGLGFALVLLPLYVHIWHRATGDSSAPAGIFSVTGIAVLVAMIAGAAGMVLRYIRGPRNPEAFRLHLIPVGFVAAAVVMVAVLFIFKGYGAFLVMTGLATLLLALLIRRHVCWEILIAIVAVSTLIIGVKPFAYAVIAGAPIIVLLGFTRVLPGWKTALAILLCAVAGFSVNVFIPIRAAQEPSINENNPQTISATIDFLDRKQYGQVSMVERMFNRRAEWANQFGNYRRMGFWNFFHRQFGLRGPSSVFLILIGLFGLWEIVRRKPKRGLPLLLLLLVCSIGLVLYMNFADGTRQHPVTGQDYLEVRERDYFFTPAFIVFGLAIGIGLAFMARSVRDSAAKRSAGLGRLASASALVLFAAPVIALAGNYFQADRSRNYLPYDYGQNLLQSAAPNSILFTHGDNDTFPLWCLQEVYGLRTDVRVVNLSLANTNWYIKQVKNHMGLDLPWSDAVIDSIRSYRLADGTWRRPQDMIVDALIDRYYGEKPLYFSVTVGSGARRYKGQPLDPRLRMVGMLFEVGESTGKIDVDVERSAAFFLEGGFQARGVNDPTIFKDEASERLTRNYGNAFLMVADTLRRRGDLSEAAELAWAAYRQIPYADDVVDFIAGIYSQEGKVDSLRLLIASAGSGDKRWMSVLLAQALLNNGDSAAAEEELSRTLLLHPDYRQAFDEVMRLYIARRDLSAMKSTIQAWLRVNPGDQQMRGLLRQLEAGFRFEEADSQ